jgi:1,4-alpha-glucan branching enzyme
MYEDFGPKVGGNNVTFQLFFPDRAKAPLQYGRGGLPRIKKIQVTGSFQKHIGQADWDNIQAPEMTLTDHPKGLLYTFATSLPDDFYEYRFYVTFEDGLTRWCNDPCTKYSGQDSNNENSGFVVGGSQGDNVKPITRRISPQDLVIYELMVDDFTTKLTENRTPGAPQKAPLDLIKNKVSYLKDLGVNAVEFMPWTATIGRGFSWGYNPFLYFSVEDRFTSINSNDPAEKLNKLSRLKELFEALHAEDIHVIMDGVFNHVEEGAEGVGFPYYWLYRYPEESPFIGFFSRGGFFKELDYQNQCTQEFVFDVCKYWLDKYQIDGIRFDYTLGFFLSNGIDPGITNLIANLRGYLHGTARENISLMLEHLTDNRYNAIADTNRIGATGSWFDQFMFKAWDGSANRVDTTIMRPMDTYKDFTPGSGPVVYIENHDHGSIVNKVGGSRTGTDVRSSNWFKSQPYAIALLTLPGAILIHNGQEFGDEYFIPEDGPDRVSPRPVNWEKLDDAIGQSLSGLYKKLIRIRHNHPSLRSPNFYPSNYDERQTRFNNEGYGVDVERKLVIYHRWGIGLDTQLERFIIVLNFSTSDQSVDIPFPINGTWKDLLNEDQFFTVTTFHLFNQKINSNWGRIFYAKG